ncbi:MAG: DUF1858 domain-containing protein [Desulfobacterales bacterium]|nr:DUF1858 domain-containing protein [Desulfobacterales bacterium]
MKLCLSADTTVKELLDRYPMLLAAFMDLGLLCVGCPTEAFHTVEDVAGEYGYDPDELILYFQRIIDAPEASAVPKP